jgi:hypothetical protein
MPSVMAHHKEMTNKHYQNNNEYSYWAADFEDRQQEN